MIAQKAAENVAMIKPQIDDDTAPAGYFRALRDVAAWMPKKAPARYNRAERGGVRLHHHCCCRWKRVNWANRESAMRGSFIAIFAAVALTVQTYPGTAWPQQIDRDGYYCANGPAHKGTYSFALKEEPDKNLVFGVSLWWPDGKNFTVVGRALPVNSGWRYENISSPNPQDHCVVNIIPGKSGNYSITIDPHARCESSGGFNAVPSRVVFTKTMRQGDAGRMLANTETFANTECPAKPAKKSLPLEVGW
jgi:hypothetical protein